MRSLQATSSPVHALLNDASECMVLVSVPITEAHRRSLVPASLLPRYEIGILFSAGLAGLAPRKLAAALCVG